MYILPESNMNVQMYIYVYIYMFMIYGCYKLCMKCRYFFLDKTDTMAIYIYILVQCRVYFGEA